MQSVRIFLLSCLLGYLGSNASADIVTRATSADVEAIEVLVAQIGQYPGRKDVFPRGTIIVKKNNSGISILGTLTGLPKNTTAGIHIHSGFSCSKAADVGGHYFEGMSSDPWTTTYTSDASGTASISLDMPSFSLSEEMPVAGRALVVHSPSARIGCGLLTVSTGVVTHIGAYPGSTTYTGVKGTVVTRNTGSGITIAGTLAGLPTNAKAGFHIHSGFSCAAAAGVGGHYFEGMSSDPWTTTYTSDADGTAQVMLDMANFSLTSSMPVFGRTLVVHSPSARIGCGNVGQAKLFSSSVQSYPGYSGKSPNGTVIVSRTTAGIKIRGTLTGLPKNTTAGIHIHSGFSCSKAADVGGHYFEGMSSDPWTTTYTSDASGTASISLDMPSFSLSEEMPVAGRALVVHSPSARIGCGLLTVSTGVVTHIGAYPGSTTYTGVKGTVVTRNTGSGITIAGTLAGLPTNAKAGFHIHSGFSCAAAAGVGGHYFEGMSSDPWTTTYTSDADGTAQVMLDMANFSLTSSMPVFGRTLVVHSPSARIGCGILSSFSGLGLKLKGSLKLVSNNCSILSSSDAGRKAVTAALAFGTGVDVWQIMLNIECSTSRRLAVTSRPLNLRSLRSRRLQTQDAVAKYSMSFPAGDLAAAQAAYYKLETMKESELQNYLNVAVQLNSVAGVSMLKVDPGSLSLSQNVAVTTTTTTTTSTTTTLATTTTTTTTSTTSKKSAVFGCQHFINGRCAGSKSNEDDVSRGTLIQISIAAFVVGIIFAALFGCSLYACSSRRSKGSTNLDSASREVPAQETRDTQASGYPVILNRGESSQSQKTTIIEEGDGTGSPRRLSRV
eukprot:TRINITY_DN5477_c1_g1_i1.p1 TRINITY_DN5477_c1_g1~~TRINITY_DN5477_c1_g1_i1.p1  ORF type:complete len:835 (-),score=148.29 TRINITY_DN5477_c1_g1_i1:136-2640(-)